VDGAEGESAERDVEQFGHAASSPAPPR
jgi:hypothetical protein